MARDRTAEIIVLHPRAPTRREREQRDLFELLASLDPESQRVVLAIIVSTRDRVRRYGPAGATVRGERGPVTWRAGEGRWWRGATEARRALFLRGR